MATGQLTVDVIVQFVNEADHNLGSVFSRGFNMAGELQNIRELTCEPDLTQLASATGLAARGDSAAQAEICGAMLWASFAAPGAIPGIFSTICSAQTGRPAREVKLDVPAVTIPEVFWRIFEDTLTGPEGGYDATSITVAVASLGAALDGGYAALSEQAAMDHPGVDRAELKPIPPMISLAELGGLPDGSLARELLSMWVDNGFDPEVLDRDAIGLGTLSPALGYLNTRILQMHDVWHLVAGYQTTSLHEMAISAFQLAQFGHNYSAMFLTTVCTMSHLRQPQGFGLLLQNLSEAWHHGVQCPPLMAVDWEQEWSQDIESLRRKLGIEPFAGSLPADLLEQLAAASP